MNDGKGGSYTTLPVVTSYQEYESDPNRDMNLANLSKIGIATDELVISQDYEFSSVWEFSAPYFVGTDGRRHAFPSVDTYFSWFPNLSYVNAVPQEKLASIPLGANVHYRSGVRMVKFMSSPKVYAVSLGGQLHWIKTEELAKELYGSDWQTKIDEINVAFFTDYVIGSDITAASDFNVTSQEPAASQISKDLGL